ncbi:MAG: hypothetical protein HOP10_04220 [Chitinophagaceae bacterium]|nr:hypothetical protein [Chitinophagaceae bacterium]
MKNENEISMYEQILRELDLAVEEYSFPVFNNPNFPVATMRIVCFRDDDEWLIVFERIAYGTSDGIFLNMISAFGNRIEERGLQSTMEFITELPGHPVSDDEMNYILNEKKFDVLIYGNKQAFSFDEKDYKVSHVDENKEMRKRLRLLRLIAYKTRQDIFMSPASLLDRMDHDSIPVFLIITEWNHPDVYYPGNEMPGLNPCFQSLAKAIAYNKKELYDCRLEKNSYWYYWDEAGI